VSRGAGSWRVSAARLDIAANSVNSLAAMEGESRD
jgi:hypothetical protein